MKKQSLGALAVVMGLLGCGTELPLEDHGDVAAAGNFTAPGEEQALTRQCKPASTVRGIDVSYWQDRIDWAQVARDGVGYAFIRVSDGSTFVDPRFQENWQGARAAGIKRGAYQFFRSNADPIEQATILLDQMGPLQPGDLPPVIDVESTDGQSKATVVRKVGQWIAHVEARLGVKPIVYTGPYFWRDSVGSLDFEGNPLWIAHYGTDCPLTPEPWANWTFHQFTDSGRVAGIRGNVDTNLFAGTRADLDALSFQGTGTAPPPPSTSCGTIPAAGRIVDEDDACFTAGGPTRYLHAEDDEGHGGLIWTMATANSTRENYGEWELRFETPGRYRVQAFTDMSVASSQLTRYRIEHDGVVETKQIDQHSVDGFRDLGTFTFTSGRAKVVLNDNTGEASSQRKKLVFDALQILPATDAAPPPAPEPTCSRVRVVNADSLNIRPSPSTSRGAIGALGRGDVVTRLSSVADGQSVSGNRTWHRVTRGSVTGYVTSYYTTCVD